MPSLRVACFTLSLAAFFLSSFLMGACRNNDDGQVGVRTRDFSAQAVGKAFNPDIQPVVINSALAVGPTRLSFGIFRSDRSLILEASGTVRLYRLDESDQGVFIAEHELKRSAIKLTSDHRHADGSIHVHEDEFAAIFYTNVEFNVVGNWAAELHIQIDGKIYRNLLTQPFNVLMQTPEPHIGTPLPASTQLILRDVVDLADIDSSKNPIPELHDLTVAEALASGKPVLVAIATPAFCYSRLCGPVMQAVVIPLWQQFSDSIQFIHIEPFELKEARTTGRLVPVTLLREWNLQSEPWIFVADRYGIVVAKFESIVDLEEVRSVLIDLVSVDVTN